MTIDRGEIERAVQQLKSGKLVIFPTETVYGLGADASNPDALRLLYATKGRPADHPVIAHFADVETLALWSSRFDERARKLAEMFWPGPMTLVLPKARHVSPLVTGGQDSVGLRIPNHPVALDLLRFFGGGVAGPSANRFGKLSPTSHRAASTSLEINSEVMLLDGGDCDVGIESTIISLLHPEKVSILRPGMIAASAIQACLSMDLDLENKTANVRAPGLLKSHYAPEAGVLTLAKNDLLQQLQVLLVKGQKAGLIVFRSWQNDVRLISGNKVIEAIFLPQDPIIWGHELYAALRTLDEARCDLILVSELPDNDLWAGPADRLRRACLDTEQKRLQV